MKIFLKYIEYGKFLTLITCKENSPNERICLTAEMEGEI